MKQSFFKGRSTHTKIFTVVTAILIIILLAINLTLTAFGLYGQLYADLTPEGFYTLSDEMKVACDAIFNTPDESGNKKNIKMIFCADPDTLTASSATRMTYFMALQLAGRYDNLTVETVNLDVNPAAVSAYKTTSSRNIKATDLITTYNGTYKIVDVSSFWTTLPSYDGEYRMVTMLSSLTAMGSPSAYFLVGHGETVYDPENPTSEQSKSMSVLAELLDERGLAVKLLDLSEVERVPDDCALIIINDPRTDLKTDPSQYGSLSYVSEAEKLDRYLRVHEGAVIFNKDYALDTPIPVFESFFETWGIKFGNGLVKDPENSVDDMGEAGSAVLGVYDAESFGGAYYGNYAALSSAPKMLFTNSGFIMNAFAPDEVVSESGGYNTQITYAPFISTTSNATAYKGPGSTERIEHGEPSVKALAAASVRTILGDENGEINYSYLLCTNTKDFFSNELLGNRAYANYDIMSAYITSVSRVDVYASMELGGSSPNSPIGGGKRTVSTTLYDKFTEVLLKGQYDEDGRTKRVYLQAFGATQQAWFTVIVSLPPLALLVLGAVVFIKRKNM